MHSKLIFLPGILSASVLIIANRIVRLSSSGARLVNTATPALSPTKAGAISMEGSTNGIAFWGIVIFSVILIAVISHLRDLPSTQRK